MKPLNKRDTPPGLSPWALALNDEIASGKMHCKKTFTLMDCQVEVMQGRDSLWVLVRRPNAGGFALRTAYSPGTPLIVESGKASGSRYEFRVTASEGSFQVQLELPSPGDSLLRCRVSLTPTADLLPTFRPHDLYMLGEENAPLTTAGQVHAAQRGLNCGIVYLTLKEPHFGSLLYFQNLTSLNDYFQATETTPDGRVGGQWPELGYQPPASSVKPLPAGREIVLSDAYIHWSAKIPTDQRRSALLFLDLLAGVYAHLERPASLYHDWPHRAEETLRDLERSPEATISHYGHRYLHPYTGTEYPDSMVQLTVLQPMLEYANWKGNPLPLAKELRAGLSRFFDPDLGTLRRYLPNVGKDKDPDEVDSWYLYHPLANLGRLAKAGDADACDLFLKSLDYGIKAARHFHYQWPVQFNIKTLEVIKGPRKPGEPGQSDTGGLYAHVMLQAFELTGKARFLEEAKKAIQTLRGMDFALEYQANITSWGAKACLWLWKITGESFYRDQSYVFLASFFHNTVIWESEIGGAKHYSVFLGATCLHDGPYMAIYECFESFTAFHDYLAHGRNDIPASVRLLLTEYCKYALSRAWYYYPKELPKEILAKEVRNGHIDRKLAFPLEDLYANGQPSGQVGQEIYGCGAAFAFATRAFHRFTKAPFLLYSEYPLFDLEESDEPCFSFRVRGCKEFSCRVRLIPEGRTLTKVVIRAEGGQEISPKQTEERHWEFSVHGGEGVEVRWDA